MKTLYHDKKHHIDIHKFAFANFECAFFVTQIKDFKNIDSREKLENKMKEILLNWNKIGNLITDVEYIKWIYNNHILINNYIDRLNISSQAIIFWNLPIDFSKDDQDFFNRFDIIILDNDKIYSFILSNEALFVNNLKKIIDHKKNLTKLHKVLGNNLKTFVFFISNNLDEDEIIELREKINNSEQFNKEINFYITKNNIIFDKRNIIDINELEKLLKKQTSTIKTDVEFENLNKYLERISHYLKKNEIDN